VEKPGRIRLEIAPRDPDRLVICLAGAGHHFSQAGFVLFAAAIFVQAESNGADVAMPFTDERGERRRIEAGRKKNADRDIGHEMMLRTITQGMVKDLALIA